MEEAKTEKKEEVPKKEPKAEEPKKSETSKKKEIISMIIFIVLGFIAGYLSFLFSDNLYALITMIIIFLVSQKIMSIALKVKEKMRWWMKNGGVVYIFIWFIIWIILYNL